MHLRSLKLQCLLPLRQTVVSAQRAVPAASAAVSPSYSCCTSALSTPPPSATAAAAAATLATVSATAAPLVRVVPCRRYATHKWTAREQQQQQQRRPPPLRERLQRALQPDDPDQPLPKAFWLVTAGVGVTLIVWMFDLRLPKSAPVPFTGRVSGWQFVPRWLERLVAARVDLHDDWPLLPPDHELSRLVHTVGWRLISSNRQDGVFDWHFRVIDSPDEMEAFASLGGNVFVTSGLLSLMQDDRGSCEKGLAAVLAREIGHCLGRHLTDGLSPAVLVYLLHLSSFFHAPALLKQWFVARRVLPEHRESHELEADAIGLRMMADACFDPKWAVISMQRMRGRVVSADGVAGAAPAPAAVYVCRYPPSERRLQTLTKRLPAAMERFDAKHCAQTLRKFWFGLARSGG